VAEPLPPPHCTDVTLTDTALDRSDAAMRRDTSLAMTRPAKLSVESTTVHAAAVVLFSCTATVVVTPHVSDAPPQTPQLSTPAVQHSPMPSRAPLQHTPCASTNTPVPPHTPHASTVSGGLQHAPRASTTPPTQQLCVVEPDAAATSVPRQQSDTSTPSAFSCLYLTHTTEKTQTSITTSRQKKLRRQTQQSKNRTTSLHAHTHTHKPTTRTECHHTTTR
jgi:hypothetical protein